MHRWFRTKDPIKKMSISQEGVNLIKAVEPYLSVSIPICNGGRKRNHVVVGWGSVTNKIKENTKIDKHTTAEFFLHESLNQVVKDVQKALKKKGVKSISQRDFDVFCSLVHSVGYKNFLESDLLAYWIIGYRLTVSSEIISFLTMDLDVLIHRRQQEYNLFASSCPIREVEEDVDRPKIIQYVYTIPRTEKDKREFMH